MNYEILESNSKSLDQDIAKEQANSNIQNDKSSSASKEESLFFKISISIIVGLNTFILFLIISFFIKKPMLKIAIIISLITSILMFIYQTFRKEKNLFVASLLNMTPLYPVGFFYTTEQALPKFDIKQMIFFFLHFLISFTIIISPLITFISGWLGYYPVKKGEELKLF